MKKSRQPDLAEIAKLAMTERGFLPDFSEEVLNELKKLNAPTSPISPCRDLRDKLWISIDNDDSKDLDQLTYAETNRVYVAVADVDGEVKPDSAIDQHAAHNTTSVYCPGKVFPMLPPKLSTGLTSLNENEDRGAMVTEFEVASDGKFELSDIYPAWVRNKAKLAYNRVTSWLDDPSTFSPDFPNLETKIPPSAILQQLQFQDQLAAQIQKYRKAQGALSFRDVQLEPIVENGVAIDLKTKVSNRGHALIENMMIAANVSATRFLNQKNFPTIRRIVRTPKKWDRIVALAESLGTRLPNQPNAKALRDFLLKQEKESPSTFGDLSLSIIKLIGRGEYVVGLPDEHENLIHFNLAESEYSHTTAPNRRYPDLIMQRLLKCALSQIPPPYSLSELRQIAAHCTEKENDANKVERRMVKCAAAMIFVKEVGKIFSALVTGAAPKGTWVRLLNAPPIEGKLVKGFKGVDVGDHIKVKLIKVDVLNGHIDFARWD